MTTLHHYLILSALLFSIGLAGALSRRNAILVLVGVELMLNAANLNFIAFWRFGPNPEALRGVMFVVFSIAIAAAAPGEFELHIRLNLGNADAVMYAADLTEHYVDFNKGDVTDPASLGG